LSLSPYNFFRFDVFNLEESMAPRRKKVSPTCLVCHDQGEEAFFLEVELDDIKMTGT
jgi:hypothetical protein